MTHRYSLETLAPLQNTLWSTGDNRSDTVWENERAQINELSVDAFRVTGEMVLEPAPGVTHAMKIRCKELQFFQGSTLVVKANLILYAEHVIGAVKITTSSNHVSKPGTTGAAGKKGHDGTPGAEGKKGKSASMFHHSKTGGKGDDGTNGTNGSPGGNGTFGEDGASAFALRAYFGSFAQGASIEINAAGNNGGAGGAGGNGGHGGHGGHGGKGGQGGDGYSIKVSGNGGVGGHGGNGGDGGKGGNGGPAGDGGNGGNIYLAWPLGVSPVDPPVVRINGGHAGAPGKPGAGGAFGPKGLGGEGGANGHYGTVPGHSKECGPEGKDGHFLGPGKPGATGTEGKPGSVLILSLPPEKTADWLLATLRVEDRVRLERTIAGPLDRETFHQIMQPFRSLEGPPTPDLEREAEEEWARLPPDVIAGMRSSNA